MIVLINYLILLIQEGFFDGVK